MNSSTLLIACDDKKGLVAKSTGALFRRELNIVSNAEFVEHETGRFFMRTEVEGEFSDADLIAELQAELPEGADVRLAPKERKRIVVMATREPHCLGDLLIRCGFIEKIVLARALDKVFDDRVFVSGNKTIIFD